MNFPADLKYTEHDEWVRFADGVATIGISDYAQDALGELVHVELPEVGTVVKAGAVVCEVESVKAVAEVYSPVAGEIIAVNEALSDEADKINSDPYGSWLFKVQVSDASSLAGLMDASAYTDKVNEA